MKGNAIAADKRGRAFARPAGRAVYDARCERLYNA